MASSSVILSSLPPARALTFNQQDGRHGLFQIGSSARANNSRARPSFRVQAAAKPPAGVELPKVEPKFEAPFLGFTKTAEIWNSRACMIGLIGTFVVELVRFSFLLNMKKTFYLVPFLPMFTGFICLIFQILNKSILQVIGVDVGKGLDLPL
ncbi:uncharacterized protein LOC103486373 isoform X1 [Cucumis melo]|uniref:Uncharacterized protein LOC103486373 isoform X1 n=1 Tax=Cucumis melo TaxID=3656 RepID=A0ABM3KQW1_CUCME|nr:uncharacterized protein LOC103486373 isoform X1 [Cucumis melo]